MWVLFVLLIVFCCCDCCCLVGFGVLFVCFLHCAVGRLCSLTQLHLLLLALAAGTWEFLAVAVLRLHLKRLLGHLEGNLGMGTGWPENHGVKRRFPAQDSKFNGGPQIYIYIGGGRPFPQRLETVLQNCSACSTGGSHQVSASVSQEEAILGEQWASH